MVFNAVFNSISFISASAPTHACLEFFSPVLCTIFFPSHWQLCHITIVETMDGSERGMNPVATTVINPRKEYWPSRECNQRHPVLKSLTLPTEPWCSPQLVKNCMQHNAFQRQKLTKYLLGYQANNLRFLV